MSISKNAGITGPPAVTLPEGSGTPVPPTTIGSGEGQGAGAIVEPRVPPSWPGYLGPAPAADTAPDCGTVDGEGRCFGALSVRCESGRLIAQRCTEGDSCAWTADGRFGCASQPRAACGPISQAGVCVGDEPRVCDHGLRRTTLCAATRCARLPESGTAGCAPPG